MKNVLIIGSGISGMSCAVNCAGKGMHVILASPFPSERAQSVMAAGGINAVLEDNEEGDTVESHIKDTLKGGAYLAGEEAVSGLCEGAGKIIKYLEDIGTVFSLDDKGRPAHRAFGGQSHKRTYYCGASTGKQIVTALNMEVRRFEAAGLIERRLGMCFHSGLIKDGVCYGAILYGESTNKLEAFYADAVVMATGGQNVLFGKTTGSTQCDGYAAGKLFEQGAVLKNLEFIQYHPTTMETAQKRMLISEAVRGEGGRLFYLDEKNERVYFMENKYGPEGNLQTRDVVSREIYETGKDVYLDISFLDRKTIFARLPEVYELCLKYRNIDITREPIPVAPSVHFFMGGLAVKNDHETSIRNLYAVGECASIYHGANRLGGNSLLAAVYGGGVAADAIARREEGEKILFEDVLKKEQEKLTQAADTESTFAYAHIRDDVAKIMQENLGIVRDEKSLIDGMEQIDFYIKSAGQIKYDNSVLQYFNYSLPGILILARAVLTCARFRKESRGSHNRKEFTEIEAGFSYPTLISYDNGNYSVRLDKEGEYES